MLRRVLGAGRSVLAGVASATLLLVVAVEGIVFAFALYANANGGDGHFRGGLVGFLVHLTLLLLAIAGLRALARERGAVQRA